MHARTVTNRADCHDRIRHLVPTLGPKRLDAITNEQVQRLKLALSERAPKTVNSVLTAEHQVLMMVD